MVEFYLDVASNHHNTQEMWCIIGVVRVLKKKKSYYFTSVKAQLYESNQTQMKENEP